MLGICKVGSLPTPSFAHDIHLVCGCCNAFGKFSPPIGWTLALSFLAALGDVGASWRCNQLSCFLAYAHEKYEKSICTWIALINVHHI